MPFFSRFFRRPPAGPDVSQWWAQAHALVDAPTAEGIAALRASALSTADAPDHAEGQQEMLDALEAVARLTAAQTLPAVSTQHRVIGADTCHYLTPASLADPVDGGGKVFVTSARLIYASGTVQTWAWHLVARIQSHERDLFVELKGRPPVRIRCNTYEDALVIRTLATMLLRQGTPNRP